MPQETKPEEKGSLLVLIISILIFALPVILLVTSLVHINRIGKQAREYVGDFKPDVSELSDGTYKGTYDISKSKTGAEIEFTIESQRVTSLTVIKVHHTPLFPASKKIKRKIENDRNLNFDAITGATNSSNLLRAAIKNALVSRQKQ